MTKVTIFNEYWHEQNREDIREIYPNGIHTAIADFLRSDDVEVRTFTLFDENKEYDPSCGLTEEILKDTDVLIWWGHMHHEKVSDEVVKMVQRNVLEGMGAIFLHSAHISRPFMALMGTSGSLGWRTNEKERLWNICPTHPIMKGIGKFVDLPAEEMYGECFDIPKPDDLLMIGVYSSYEVFRSACTWNRGYGKVFYFQPGHEEYPTYYIPEVQKIIKNAVEWAKPIFRAELSCPRIKKVEL